MSDLNQRPTLNADQQAGLSDVSSFLISDRKEFFLTGSPGVGKTFTTNEIVRQVPVILSSYHTAMNKKHIDKQTVLTSMTNKAATVLANETGLPAMTIHSFLGVVPKNNYRTGRTTLTKNNRWKVHSNVILILDEAPMAGSKLYNLINEAMDSSCKIIYIGDKNQLAPVMEKSSPVSDLTNDPINHYTITTPVRNSGSPGLMDLCDRLRYDVENETPRDKLTHWHEVPHEVVWIDGPQFQELVDRKYGPNGRIKPGDPDIKGRILSYTNKTAIAYNQYIRKERNLPLHPTVGETLISNCRVEISRSQSINVEDDVLILGVDGPFTVNIDNHNQLSAYELEVSTAFTGSVGVMIPEDMHKYDTLSKHFAKNKDWHSFYGMQEQFVDLRDRESSTVHKAQGSTYDFVIMVMPDIFTCRDTDQLRRMLYVAASRARKKVYVFDNDIHSKPRRIYQ